MAFPNPLRCRHCGRTSTFFAGFTCRCTGRPVEKIDARVEQLLHLVLTASAPMLRVFRPEPEGGDQ